MVLCWRCQTDSCRAVHDPASTAGLLVVLFQYDGDCDQAADADAQGEELPQPGVAHPAAALGSCVRVLEVRRGGIVVAAGVVIYLVVWFAFFLDVSWLRKQFLCIFGTGHLRQGVRDHKPTGSKGGRYPDTW